MLKNLKVSLFLAYRSIKRGNLGTLILTIVIMSLIFVNMIILPSFVSGIGEAIVVTSIGTTYGNIIIEPKENDIYINDVNSIQKKLNGMPGVVGTASRYRAGATLTYKNDFVSGAIHSMNPADEEVVSIFHKGLIDGEFLSKEDTNEILLGIDLVGKEGEEGDQSDLGGRTVGDKITVTFSNGIIKEYRLKGIFSVSSMGVDSYAFISEKEMESVLGVDNKASEILVKLNQRGTEKEFKKKIMELGISEDIKTYDDKLAGTMENIIGSFSFISIISTVISLIMAVIVIFIIIYINTVNKRKQIGILKAIGINQRVIIHSYVIQALFYCFLGIVFGLIILWFLVLYMVANPIPFPIGDVMPIVEQQLIIQSILSLIVVSLIAGYIPSWKTARENILKAIWG